MKYRNEKIKNIYFNKSIDVKEHSNSYKYAKLNLKVSHCKRLRRVLEENERKNSNRVTLYHVLYTSRCAGRLIGFRLQMTFQITNDFRYTTLSNKNIIKIKNNIYSIYTRALFMNICTLRDYPYWKNSFWTQ